MPDEHVEAILAEAQERFEADLAELEPLSGYELAQLDELVTAPGFEPLEEEEPCNDMPKLTDEEWQFVLDSEAGRDG
jgi:hypothetical protein